MTTHHEGDQTRPAAPVASRTPDTRPYSARAAAEALGYSRRTASQRALRAFLDGDHRVQKVGTSWVAPLSWWRELFKDPPQRGRPPTREARYLDR